MIHLQSLDILREAWAAGVVLAGISAGAICRFEEGLTDSAGRDLQPMDCLGFLSGSCCPHFDGEAERRPAFYRLLTEGLIGAGVAIDDDAAIHYIDQTLHRVVSARTKAGAYTLSFEDGKVSESCLPVQMLNSPMDPSR